MIISHISDIHLGYAQFNLQEREEDLYDVFEESIDKSIQEHVEAVILSGDIFHNPKPHGSAIIKLARELKKLKDKSIPVYFILGEHDISRTNDVPLPFLFHNLGLAKRLKSDSPVYLKDLMIYGFNKQRRSNIENGLLKPFKKIEKFINSEENKKLKKILVLHQGLSNFNKFAGEIFASDLPLGFNYYAMGHYHDHVQKNFSELDDSLVAYPGSLDLGHNEPISDVEKGFLLVDFSASSKNVTTNWVKIEKRRPQISQSVEYGQLDKLIEDLIILSKKYQKRPVLDLKLKYTDVDPKILSGQLSKLNDHFLYYTWSFLNKASVFGYSYDLSDDFKLDKELLKLIYDALKSDNLTNLSLDLIQMINGKELYNNANVNKNKIKKVADCIWQYYENNKNTYQKRTLDFLK
ncbi:MAG: metallophosphoesterase family protein [Candidatus Nitrosocosmicus sp.]